LRPGERVRCIATLNKHNDNDDRKAYYKELKASEVRDKNWSDGLVRALKQLDKRRQQASDSSSPTTISEDEGVVAQRYGAAERAYVLCLQGNIARNNVGGPGKEDAPLLAEAIRCYQESVDLNPRCIFSRVCFSKSDGAMH
jgi:hypothetical protein